MRWILRFRVFIIICLAVTLISAAVVFSILRAVLPYATGYKNEIQQEISQQIGLPVEIESIDAAIHWFSPRLKLIGVSVYDEKNKVPLFNFKEAFVGLDAVASIMHGDFIVADIGLIGADLSIEKTAENEWLVQGIRFTSEGSSELPERFLYMLLNSDYLLHDSNIYYQDHTGEKLNLSLLDVNMDVENNFNNHNIKFSMNLPDEYGRSLAVVANLQGDLDALDGDVYIEVQELKLNQWNKKFSVVRDYSVDAVLDVNLWGTVENNVVESILTRLVSRNLSIANKVTGKHWKTPYLATDLRYIKDDEHRSLTVSDFYFGAETRAAWGRPVTILASDDDEFYYLSADFLRLKDLHNIAAAVVTPALSQEVKDITDRINQYQLSTDVYNLNLQLPKELTEEVLLERLVLDVSLSDFSMNDISNNIRLSGLDASLQYADRQLTVELESKDTEVELKDLFRHPITADNLHGKVTLNYGGDTWQVNSSQLQFKNSHINSFSRFHVMYTADEDTFVDLQTDFYDAYGKYATQYLPVGIMKASLIDWLDMAVTDGYVPEGSLVLHGNPGHFPYDGNDGVFQVLFTPQEVNLQFLEGWPLLSAASGILKFNNSSLIVSEATGRTQEVELYNGYAEFLDMRKPHLTVKTDARGKNEEMQSYVLNSPLEEILGDAMRLFQFKGSNELNLTIEVPLDDKQVDVAIDGHLNFIDTQIYYPDLGYEINAINGVVDFTKDSVFADSVVASIENRPVEINAYTNEGDYGQQVVFHLDGVVGIDYLLQSYHNVPRDWLSGQSMWSMDFEIPYDPEDYQVHVSAYSYLEDVIVQVSDKVQKDKGEKLKLAADINILDGRDLRVNASFIKDSDDEKEIIDLFAIRTENKVWRFDIRSHYLTGKGEFAEGLGKETQIKLDLAEVDLHALFVTEDQKGSEPLTPSDFPPLEWKAKKVLWDNWLFTDVELGTDWHEHGMLINKLSLHGPAMAFDARGTWLTSWNGSHETVLQGNINSSNCGTTLVGLGYQRSLDRCVYNATFNSKWPAEPYHLSWANMKGKSSFEMKDGEILEVDPGAGGRLLGLLNIFKLANRLAFDFDDVTREGFSFDRIKGDFEFANGEGSLKNFDISAPAADINMFGRIGMAKQDYGLLMRVKPHTDTLTFAGGALLGGVVVGASLALIQKVFDLGVIGHNVYSITGTWDEPVIEKIVERRQATTEDEDL